MHRPTHCRKFVLAALLATGTAGCSSQAVNPDAKTTFLTADDMVAMTNKMAASITSDPYIQQAAAKGPLVIVIKPVENETDEVIVDNRRELFVARLQGLLAREPALKGRFVWVMNRADYEKLRHEEFPQDQLGASEDRIQPEFALWAEFLSDTNVSRSRRSDAYLCQYKLTRLSGNQAGAILWSGQYETSKHIKRGLLD